MHTLIVVVFIVGYLFIALEGTTHIHKSGIALLMSAVCWTLYIASPEGSSEAFTAYVAETSETILFLLGAMAIMEILDRNGCFNFLIGKLRTQSAKALLWKTMCVTFFLSAVLDNMTTSILMIMMLRHLVSSREMRLFFAGIIIIAANAGGAFSPIGDVTTIMLWINGNVSTTGILRHLFIPSIICVLVPTFFVSMTLGKKHLPIIEESTSPSSFAESQRTLILGIVGVLGLMLVPLFRSLTGLPPFVGIMGVLALLWIISEVSLSHDAKLSRREDLRVAELVKHIDLSTILFFLGILLSIGTLRETGTLAWLGNWIDTHIGNVYAVNAFIGVLSSVVDNVPLMAGCMSMYSIEPSTVNEALQCYTQDGIFWQLLAYCAGTGGSLLIIGSAAGVVVMGLEKISFGWYLRHFTLLALAGYAAGFLTLTLTTI